MTENLRKDWVLLFPVSEGLKVTSGWSPTLDLVRQEALTGCLRPVCWAPARFRGPQVGVATLPLSFQLALGLLVADFSAMVNNPHLSDIQFQIDSGEVLYAHKFVLYARCPLLMQHVSAWPGGLLPLCSFPSSLPSLSPLFPPPSPLSPASPSVFCPFPPHTPTLHPLPLTCSSSDAIKVVLPWRRQV